MDKHTINHPKKRKQSTSRKSAIIAIVSIVLILFFAGLLFVKPILVKQKYDTYNHFEFEKTNEYWQTRVEYNNYVTPITFTSHPLDLEDIFYNETITSYVLNKPHVGFVIAIKEDAGSVPVIAGVNIARILGERFYGFEVNSALYVEPELINQTNTTIPIVSCDDATEYRPIIFIDVNSEKQSIDFSSDNGDCIIIRSSSEKKDILEMADLFVYKILEIM